MKLGKLIEELNKIKDKDKDLEVFIQTYNEHDECHEYNPHIDIYKVGEKGKKIILLE